MGKSHQYWSLLITWDGTSLAQSSLVLWQKKVPGIRRVKGNTTFTLLQPGLDLHDDNDENREKSNSEIDFPCVNPATSIGDDIDKKMYGLLLLSRTPGIQVL